MLHVLGSAGLPSAGITVGVSGVIADRLHLGDVFGGLEVYGVGIFVVILFFSIVL